MNAETLEIHATVGLTVFARNTMTARQIRLNRTAIAFGDARNILSNFENFDSKLVPETARIGKKRLPALKCMKIGSADSNSVNADHGAIRSRRRGLVYL